MDKAQSPGSPTMPVYSARDDLTCPRRLSYQSPRRRGSALPRSPAVKALCRAPHERQLGLHARAPRLPFRPRQRWRLGSTYDRLFGSSDGAKESCDGEDQPTDAMAELSGSGLTRASHITCWHATFGPGQFISQRELVELTGLPLGAIRELVPRLEAEGLIKTVPQRGMLVAHVDVSLNPGCLSVSPVP